MNDDNFDKKNNNQPEETQEVEITEKKQSSFYTFIKSLKPDVLFILLFSAYIVVNTANLASFKDLMYNVEINAYIPLLKFFGSVAAVFIVIFIIYLGLRKQVKHIHRFILFFSSVIFSVGLVGNKNLNIAYNITVLAVLFYIIKYCFDNKDNTDDKNDKNEKNIEVKSKELISFRTMMILISILVMIYTIVLSEACIMRYKTFLSSTYDFGIFAQMFESMAKTGLQTTTVERNISLSHFAVHFSPIYYLILPFYMPFRSPESLLVIQALAVAAGTYPLALIAKHFKLSHTNILLIVVTYLCYPAVSGGLFFDFHENKFLTVLILWLMYFVISDKHDNYKKYIPVYIFAALVLMVKEDSFLYVICIALYMMTLKKDGRFSLKNLIHGLIIAGISILYFAFSTYYLDTYGLGVMTYRFDLFLRIGEDGFLAMIMNVLKNPALLLASLISVPEKLEFIFYMFIPLCFLPFAGKKFNFIFLIVPMIIINLATDYIYQYDVNFQYTYGVIALLFFLTLENLSKINPKHITRICVTMACFSVVLFASKNYNRIHAFNFVYFSCKSDFVEAEQMIEQIPIDASVSATTFLVSHLIQRDNVYMVDLFTDEYFDFDTDYLVNDLREVDLSRYKEFLKEIDARGYRKINAGEFVEVFQKVTEE